MHNPAISFVIMESSLGCCSMSITLQQLDLQPELKFQAGFSLLVQQERT